MFENEKDEEECLYVLFVSFCGHGLLPYLSGRIDVTCRRFEHNVFCVPSFVARNTSSYEFLWLMV
jgi:hypothetical protein